MEAGAKLTATFGPNGFFLSICSLLTVAFTIQPCVQSVPLAGRTSTGPLRLIASLRATISEDMRSVPAARKRWLTSRLERSGNAIAARTATMANTVTSSTTVKTRIAVAVSENVGGGPSAAATMNVYLLLSSAGTDVLRSPNDDA